MNPSLMLMIYGSSAAIALGVLVATLRVRGRSTFRLGIVVYLVGTAWWALVDAWRWSAGEGAITATEAWTLPATALVVAGVRVAVIAATRPSRRLGRLDAAVVAAHPVAALIAAAVPAWRSAIATVSEHGAVAYGGLFFANAAISYALLVAATVDLVRPQGQARPLNRRSVPIVVAVWAVPLVASIVTVTSEGPAGVDLMPPGFALTALLVWRAVVPAHLGHVARVTRSQVFDELTDAVVVVGDKDEVLDANLAALTLAGAASPIADLRHKPLRAVWPALADVWRMGGEHDLTVGGRQRVVEVRVTPLVRSDIPAAARLIVVRDVTDDAHLRRELADLRAELADLVIRDVATGLHNRRYADRLLPEQLMRCSAKGMPLSIVLMDVDHFKAVNDNYGHAVGDRVLMAIAGAMVAEVPESMAARVGGEEFLVVLPGLAKDDAMERAERLRAACAATTVAVPEGHISITVSAGVATAFPADVPAEALLVQADNALYRAKREGRDRSCSAPAHPDGGAAKSRALSHEVAVPKPRSSP